MLTAAARSESRELQRAGVTALQAPGGRGGNAGYQVWPVLI